MIIPGLCAYSLMPFKEAVEKMYGIFADEYTVYLFDSRTDIGENYSIEKMADDIADRMKELGIEKAVLYGVSQGGMIALCLAILHPELAESLVISSSMARNSESSRAVFELWKKEPPAELCAGATEEEMRRFRVKTDAALHFDIYDRLPEIRCRVFALGGRKDTVTGIIGTEEIAKQLNCKSYIYEDYGHFVYDEAPDYLERVKRFLDEQNFQRGK